MTGERIVIVDDNKELLEELKETLGLCGYDAKTVSDGRAAFKLALRFKPDIILLDLKMPGSSGFDVAERLKQNKETAGIPIIAMSGYFPIDKQGILLEMSNMDGRIKKPFEITNLVTEIENILNNTGKAALG